MKSYTFDAPFPFEFEIKDLSKMNKKSFSITGQPHRADFYQILWISKGQSVQVVDFTPIELQGGQMLFISRNQVMSFDVKSEYEGKIILFTNMFFSKSESDNRFINRLDLFNTFSTNKPITIDNNIKRIWQLIDEEFAIDTDKYTPDVLHNHLHNLLIYSERISNYSKDYIINREYHITLQFSEQVELHYKTKRKVNEYIASMSVSSKVLTNALKITIGKSPKQFIDERILLEAKRLLIYSEWTVKEISFDLGFEEPTNFSQFFRKQTGLSPIDFKKHRLA